MSSGRGPSNHVWNAGKAHFSFPQSTSPDCSSSRQKSVYEKDRLLRILTREPRKRKLKCDRVSPCSQCQKSHRHCKYTPDGQSSIASDGDSDLETEERAPKRQQSGMALFEMSPSQPSYTRNGLGLRELGNPGGVDDMASRLERLETMLRDKQSPGDLISPASVRAQKYQPRTQSAPFTIRTLSIKEGARTRFFGQNSPRVLLNLVCGGLAPSPSTRGYLPQTRHANARL